MSTYSHHPQRHRVSHPAVPDLTQRVCAVLRCDPRSQPTKEAQQRSDHTRRRCGVGCSPRAQLGHCHSRHTILLDYNGVTGRFGPLDPSSASDRLSIAPLSSPPLPYESRSSPSRVLLSRLAPGRIPLTLCLLLSMTQLLFSCDGTTGPCLTSDCVDLTETELSSSVAVRAAYWRGIASSIRVPAGAPRLCEMSSPPG